MLENPVFIVIVVGVAAGIVAFIAYRVARFMRGTIKLSMPRTAFNPGDTITGSFALHTKKAIQGNRLIVRLIGVEVTETRRDGKTQTRSREIYRDDVVVEEARAYPADYTATHSFEIPTPDMQSPEFLNSTAGQALTTAFRLLSNRTTRWKWKVEARLDAKGIDLATSKRVSINLRPLG